MSRPIQNDISGKLCLITGSSGGIGTACARALVLRDTDLALHYSSNADAVEALAAELSREYGRARPESGRFLRITTHRADLSAAEGSLALLEDVQRLHGRSVDVLVSNAGVGRFKKDVWDIELEDWDAVMGVNLRASFLLAKYCVRGVAEGEMGKDASSKALRGMKEKEWGRLIFVSSIAGYGAGVNGCHYAASKGGLTGMMKNLSTRLAEFNITANDVCPAMIGDTGMFPSSSAVPSHSPDIPLGRLGTPEECANVVVMFATTGYMTGQSVLVAGGLNHK